MEGWAIRFLEREGELSDAPRPRLIPLDIHLPELSGHEVSKIIKNDSRFKIIPFVVLSGSPEDADFVKCYSLHANWSIRKARNTEEFAKIVRCVWEFWFSVDMLPPA